MDRREEMKEARITINNRELTEAQSMVVRVALIAFLGEMSDRGVTEALGNMAIMYHQRLTEVLGMIDETPAEPSKPDEDLVLKSLDFISELIKKRPE
jgi:hypothetical protein